MTSVNTALRIAVLVLFAISSSGATVHEQLVGLYEFLGDFSNHVTTENALPGGPPVNSPQLGDAGGKVGRALSQNGGDNDHMRLVVVGINDGQAFTQGCSEKLARHQNGATFFL